jgi:hypothetical protein
MRKALHLALATGVLAAAACRHRFFNGMERTGGQTDRSVYIARLLHERIKKLRGKPQSGITRDWLG